MKTTIGFALSTALGLLCSLQVFSQTTTSQTLTTGSWVAPTGVTRITVQAWGGGGSGGGSTANNSLGGGGGAGGAYASSSLTVVPATSYPFLVGVARTGTQAAGVEGNPSWFGSVNTVYAEGGAGGGEPNGALGTLGGIGSSSASIGNITVQAGGSGGLGTALTGGNGGAGGNGGGAGGTARASGGDGNDGAAPGGGGGGAYVNSNTNRNGGDGAAGRITLTWVVPPTVTNLSPNRMCDGTSANINITGTNFTGASTVTFNGVSVPFVVNSATSITATVPATGISTGNVVVTNGGNFSTSTATFTVAAAASGPGAITGLSSTCPGITGLTYSVAAVAGATTYTWTVPTGWTITAGQNTTSITATAGAQGQNGEISVITNNTCTPSKLPVFVSCNTWYSYQSGDYNDFNTWTLDPSGSTFDNPFNVFPTAFEEIVILNGFTVNVNVSNQNLSTTTIQGGGILDMTTTTGHNLGVITGTGLMRIKGVNLPTGTYTDFVSTLGGTIEYYDIGGNLPTTQTTTYNKLKMTNSTGGNITYVLVSNLVVNNTFDLSTTGAGTVTWQINSNANAQRTVTLNGNLNVASGGRITAGTGNSTSTTPHSLTVYGNIVNNGIIQFFDPTQAPFTSAYTSSTVLNSVLKGNAVNVTFSGANDQTVACNNATYFYRLIVDKGTGQQAMLTINSSAASNMRLFGPANRYSTGTSSTSYSNCALSLINGTLQLTGTLAIPTLIENGTAGLGTDLYTIPQNAALWLNSPNVSVTLTTNISNNNEDQRLLANGLFRVSNGATFDGGFSRGIGSAAGGSVIVEGTNTVVKIWQYRPIATGTGIFTYQQTGGTVSVGTTGFNGTPATAGPDDGVGGFTDQYARFSLGNTNSSFQMSGGTINIGSPTTGAAGGGALAGGLDIQSTPANFNVTGGTINVYVPRNTSPTAPSTNPSPLSGSNHFTIYSTAPLGNINIYREGTTDNRQAILNSALVVLGNVFIDGTNTPIVNCNSKNVTIGGNLTISNGATFTPGTSVITFNGTGAQALTNNGNISTLANTTVVVNKAAGSVLTLGGTTSPVLPATLNSLTLTSGTLADGGTTVTVTTNLTNNAIHTSTGTGSITYTGTNAIGGANGVFGNLTISTNNTVATSGAQTVTGILRLLNTNTTLNIASHNLTVLGNIYSDAGTSTVFGNTKRILTSGLHNAGGLTRQGIAGDLLFPVGSGTLYTPSTINVAATTQGALTVRPVNSEHPNVATTGQSVQYYWRVSSVGYTGITSVTHSLYDYSTATEGNGSANYRQARFDRTSNTWGYNNTTTFNATASPPIPTFNTGTGWTIVGDRLDGEYTAGNAIAFDVIKVYYSKASGPWSALSTWTNTPGHVGPDATTAPCSSCPVIVGDGISNSHTVTMDNHNLGSGSLEINTGSTIDCAEKTGLNFGAGSGGVVSGRGTLRIGTPNFPAGDFTNFIGAAGGTVEWYAFMNNGSLRGVLTSTSGAVSGMTTGIYTNVQASATSGVGTAARFTVVVGAANTITSVTVTQPGRDYAATNTVTFNGSLFGGTGSRVFTIGATNVAYEIPSVGPLPQSINLTSYYNLAVNPDGAYTIFLPKTNLTVYNNWTQLGTGTTTNSGAFTTSIANNFTISSGTLTLTNLGNNSMTVGANVLNDGTFNATSGTHGLSVVGNFTNNGTVNFNNAGTIALTFTGTSNTSLTGTGAGGTTLATLVVNKGTSQTPILTVDVGGTVTAANSGWLTLTSGTIFFNNTQTYTLVSSANTFTIPAAARLHVGQGTVNVVTNASDAADLLLIGTLAVSDNGTVTIAGGTSGNDIEYASAGTPTISVAGNGILNVNGSIRRSTTTITGALVYNQAGGVVTVAGRNANNTRGVFEIDANAGSNFTMTGNSVLNVQRQTGGTGYADVFINPMTSTVASSSTITVGLATNVTQATLRINIAPAIGNLTILNGAGTNPQTVRMYSNPLVVKGNLTIPTPSVLITNSLDVSIAGNLICDGTYTGGTNNTTFNGSGAQTGQLSATSTFYDFTVNKATGTTLTLSGTSPTLQNLYILSGVLDVGTLALDVRRNITNNSEQVGDGSILIYSTTPLSNTITSANGSFTNITLGGNAASKSITVNGNTTIKGVLTFPAGLTRFFNIQSNLLTFDVNASVANATSFGYVRTNGVAGDLGVEKNWATGAAQTFTYEIGASTNYTPVSYTLDVATAGTLSVAPVNSAHPTYNQNSPEQILRFYWVVSRGSTLDATASGPHIYKYPSSLIGGSGGTLVAGYLDGNADPLGWTTSGHGGSAVLTQMTFAATPSTNLPSPGNYYDYSVGTANTLPNPILPLYSRLATASVANTAVGGNWTAATAWTADPTGMGAISSFVPNGVPVVILSGARINTNSNGRRAYRTVINGLLNNDARTGHNFGIISGTGTFRTATNTFPAGNYTAFVNAGGGTIEYVAPMTMNNRAVYNNLSIYSGSSGDVTMTASDITLNGNLIIPVGTTLTNAANDADITISGNWNNNGTFVQGSATVTFAGANNQTVQGTNAFHNLTIDKTSGNVTLGTGTTTIDNTLTLTSGNVVASSTNVLQVGTANIVGGSANSFVAGPMTKSVSASSTFQAPLGSVSAARYRPATIANADATDVWSFEYVGKDPTTDGYPNASLNTVNIGTVSKFEYWQISRSGATMADLTLTYNTGSYVPSDIGVVENLRVARWNGTQWDLPPTDGGTFSQSGSNVAGSVTVTRMTNFSPQTLASTDVGSPLPVELVSFTGRLISIGAELKWKTASEVDNDYFDVEKSVDGRIFKKIAQIDGSGTSNVAHNYAYVDEDLSTGKTYYRLKQVNFNGESTYSSVVVVEYLREGPVTLSVYPNPTMGNVVTIAFEGLSGVKEMPVIFYDQLGKVQKIISMLVDDRTGTARAEVSIDNLTSGVYILKFENTRFVQKLIVTK
ncbi:glycine-rich domain-containing protein [Pseudochryseolinea flava]|uniref:Secretion system C-terminal sorting domain-containing protein n=1 Tax=Pseudochryseolinea flava TaxID=2059302 RepID=A0A364Y3S2_9BACT|nr:T9SS type A sorting domain-containing protein [Pseudochryseolinea flava]RAW01600.1 hypothetical protein DQQ10_08045 [Pseudochryseolinea flava]